MPIRRAKRGPSPLRRPVTRYHAPDGRRCTSTAPGGIRSDCLTETYFAKVKGRWRSIGTADIGQAWINLRQGAFKQKPAEPEPEPVTLEAHREAFLESLRQRGVSAFQVKVMTGNLRTLCALAGWTMPVDLSPESLLAALDTMRRRGKAAQTRKHHHRHVFQFARWLVERHFLDRNPFTGMRPPSTRTDRRHDRRCPAEKEVAALFAYLESRRCPKRRGMSGRQRALGYRVAMATGFRAGELRSLTPESFDLDAGTVTLAASADKRRRSVVQPLPGWLVESLRSWFADHKTAWENFPAINPGRLLKADMKAAKVPWSVPGPDGPLFFDFHALRVWYITQLASQPGIDPKTLMDLARHSDPRLTLAVYAKSQEGHARAVVEQIPKPGDTAAYPRLAAGN